jgi:hypothetical protein
MLTKTLKKVLKMESLKRENEKRKEKEKKSLSGRFETTGGHSCKYLPMYADTTEVLFIGVCRGGAKRDYWYIGGRFYILKKEETSLLVKSIHM